MLAHALTQGTTVAVVGSGCSTPLGYPTWKSFAAEVVDLALTAAGDGGQRERLLRFKAKLDTPRVESQDLMFMIGACERLFAGYPPEDNLYRRYLKEHFQPPKPRTDTGHNPYRALLELPIHRFVTTNYDCEIELALKAVRGIEWDRFGIAARTGRTANPGPYLSFTQEGSDQLALFVLSRVGAAENMVFHCHGRYDDPESIIATELDYQRWYFSEEEDRATAFLQTFDLLLSSNPILFVGYGLRDEDLLRPLRRIAATNPERKELRPLFALLSEDSPGKDWDRHEQLFERYGLNVIPYSAPASTDPQAWGQALCAELALLKEERLRWRDGWLDKPLFRGVTVHARPPQPYRHYSVDPRGHETLGRKRVAGQLETLKEQALAGARVIGLVGPGGTGKSWHAMRLLEVMERETPPFEGFFFWSSYYADDSVTFLDRLLGYIEPRGDRSASRLTRLRACLERGRYLIVLDGLERLLQPADDPEEGRSNDPIIRRLLEIFAHQGSQSTLVLTSRLWPSELGASAPGIKRHTLERLRTGDLQDVEPFSWLDHAEVSALCSLLEGHAYALFLADRFIRQGQPAAAPEHFLRLRRALSSAPPDRRLASMMELAIEALDNETGGLARALLERLAVFMSPVTEETVQICFELAARQTNARDVTAASVHQVKEKLLAGGLLFRVTSGPTERETQAFTVHPTVRSYVFQQTRQIERDVLPSFTLAGFTSGRAPVHPGSRATAKLVHELFDRLHEEAVRAADGGRTEVARGLCRNLFGVVRSRMEANTVPRWTTYPEYVRIGLRLADLVKRLSPGLWSFREPHELTEIEHAEAPLYADELAFVYNDVGLALCAEGYMPDTLAVWEQGFEINRILEGTAEIPLYTLQSQLHMGHTFLELGNLPVAAQYLEETARTNHRVSDRDYGGRILGYQALIRYYQGHFEEADAMFRKALAILKKAGGNPRAQSFFLSHWAKLAITAGHFDKAAEYVGSSRALAASGQAQDLLAYARTAQGRLYREQGAFAMANAEYHAALTDARRLGIRRLEAEILTGLARLALRLEDAALARRRAMAALGIANELGLGLRQTQSMLVLGVATARAGQPQLGRAYVRLAKQLGNEQEYWLRSREAEEHLQKLGEGTAG